MKTRRADIEGESPSDEGQAIPYYRKSKYPPGSKVPSVWDMEYDEGPVQRLGKPGSAKSAAAAILASNAWPGAPAQRHGPVTSWADHRYTLRRNPSDLYTDFGEADDDLISDGYWPVRETNAAAAAKRVLGRR